MEFIYNAIYLSKTPSYTSNTCAWLFTQYFPLAIKAIGVLLLSKLAPSSPIKSNSLSNKYLSTLSITPDAP